VLWRALDTVARVPVARVPSPEYEWGADTGPAGIVDAVRRACRDADGHDPLDEASSLRLKHHGLEGSTLWVADAAGFAFLHDGAVDLAVTPTARRQGHGSALAAAALAGDAPRSAWSHGDHPGAARLAAAHGLRRVRELWVMRRRLDGTLPDLVAPDGVTIRGFAADDAAEVVRVNAAAFAAHPEQGGMDAANLAERMGEEWFDPDGLVLAESEGRLLGFHWTKRHSETLGEVYVVGIDPAAQGRGLGKVLTLAGLRHLQSVGVREVLLYVESDNSTGVRLYGGLGFTHATADTHVQYRRPG
jgi:mycothiol synthase